ncbi:hypothetical protein J2Y48_003431 [Mycoplana sp. BE70]|nr:hypothetical protein [Mycoplana sp. BE70]
MLAENDTSILRTLLNERAQIHRLFGLRWSSVRLSFNSPTIGKTQMAAFLPHHCRGGHRYQARLHRNMCAAST